MIALRAWLVLLCAVPLLLRAAEAPVQRAAQPAVQAAVPAKPAPRAEQPKAQDDFFAKYDDPEYINRRLAELKREREQQGKQ